MLDLITEEHDQSVEQRLYVQFSKIQVESELAPVFRPPSRVQITDGRYLPILAARKGVQVSCIAGSSSGITGDLDLGCCQPQEEVSIQRSAQGIKTGLYGLQILRTGTGLQPRDQVTANLGIQPLRGTPAQSTHPQGPAFEKPIDLSRRCQGQVPAQEPVSNDVSALDEGTDFGLAELEL